MDTLTHALSGALLGRATARKTAPPGTLARRVAAGFLATAAPDLDFVVSYAGPLAYLVNHRGVTHSLILLPLWALLLSWLLAKILREPGGWRALYGICALGIATHIAGDVITSFGTIVFAPVLDWRVALGTTFIIDLWFTGIIVAGLAASLIFRKSRIPAVAASALLAAYVGFQYVQKQKALEFGHLHANNIPGAVVSVQPRPVSPFNWTVFITTDTEQRYAHVNLVREEPRRYQPGDGFIARIDAPYMPLSQAIWVTQPRYGHPPIDSLARDAWNSPALAFFRWFAALPAFAGVSDGSTCVWFTDLRFLTPGRDRMPFVFGACREQTDGPWRAYERTTQGGRMLLR